MEPFPWTRRDRERTSRQNGRRRRVLYYLAGMVAIVLVYTVAYKVFLTVFEDTAITFSNALLTVVESFTTTGYGEDAGIWSTWQVHYLVIGMQVTGVALIFLALPVFVAPWVEERLTTTAPTALREGLTDHVVICGYTSRGQALIDELEARKRQYVVVEPDRDRATDLYETDVNVVHGDPESRETLDTAGLGEAAAVVADVDDATNASIILAAREFDGALVTAFVEDRDIAPYLRYAGADRVFSPRQLIGESIARKVTAGVTPSLDGAVEIDEDFDIAELPVQAGAELAGRTIGQSGIRERTGTNVIGAWFRGEFVSPPPPEARIDEQTILVVAGRENQLEQLKGLTLSERRRRQRGPVVVAGYGEVGTTVARAVADSDVETTIVDRRDVEGVDVVGDVTDEETLREAGVETASTVILALADDTVTVFAALVARELNPDVEIIARADATESVRKLYQAGADYVLALATVSGRMLASSILEEEVISFDKQIEVVRLSCGRLAGETLGGADVRARTGCTVIAVERDGEVVTDLSADFRIEQGDKLVVAGTDDDVNRFAGMVEGTASPSV